MVLPTPGIVIGTLKLAMSAPKPCSKRTELFVNAV